MPQGPGKYDDVTEAIVLGDGADFCCVLVLGGKKGSGFSVSMRDPRCVRAATKALRDVADQMARDADELERSGVKSS